MNPNGLIARLRKRRVFRSAGYYVLGSWVLLQVGDVVSEPAGLPAWSMTALLWVLVLGFPMALFLGWRYDITDHGVVRTLPGDDDDVSPEDLRLRTRDYLVIAAMVAILGAAAWQLAPMARDRAPAGAGPAETRTAVQDFSDGSVAVLPFVDLSQGGGQGFLAHGISDTVTHMLSQVDGLSVTARTSAFAFEDSNLAIGDIATALGVQHLLEGSVQKAGEQVRIIARLIDTRDGAEVWSGYYDRGLDSIFDIQDEIAQEVTTAMMTEVLGAGDVEVARGYQPDLAAYEQVILGREALALDTMEGAQEAMERFERAIEIDPDYALPHAMLSRTIPRNAQRLGLQRAEMIDRTEVHVDRALDLDPLLPEAHAERAQIQLARKQLVEAEASAQRALELSPSFAYAYSVLSRIYYTESRFEDALAAARKAVELDPESNAYQLHLSRALWDLGRSEAAISAVREAIERNPDIPGNYNTIARQLRQMGRSGEALYWEKRAWDLDPNDPRQRLAYCQGLLQVWAFDEATACIGAYREEHPDDYEANNYYAHLTGDVELGLASARATVEANPNFWYPRMQLADWLILEELPEEMIGLFRESFPGLFLEPPVVQPISIWAARNLVFAYQQLGQDEKANALIDAALAHIEEQRNLQGTGMFTGTDDVVFLAQRGDIDQAVYRLTEAIDHDWQFFSWGLVINPLLPEALVNDAGFQAQVERLADIMAGEYAWYQENKDRDLPG